MTQLRRSSTRDNHEPADAWARRARLLAPGLALGLALLAGSAPAAASTCAEQVQGRIAWDYRGSKQWNPANVQRLCQGAEDSAEPARCFQQVMHGGVDHGAGTTWSWQDASRLCAGSRDHGATVSCFRSRVGSGLSRAQAIDACRWDQGPSTPSGSASGFDVLVTTEIPIGEEYRRIAVPAKSPIFQADLNEGPQTLRGFVDLHTHPMNHLAFGGKVFHGAPGVGVLMPAKTIDCDQGEPRRARSVAEALGSDNTTHGGWGLDNGCGNELRRQVINQMEEGLGAQSEHGTKTEGFPSFVYYPRHNDITHQQMYVDWIERAWRGGMRVLVALATNSVTLATGVDGNRPFDDAHTGDLQIDELKRFAGRHGFMEVAYSAGDLRRIVGQDKLAVILGVELDDMANLLRFPPRDVSDSRIRAEVDRLHARGVRYIFPIHVIDNHFGGAALYENSFVAANRFHAGHYPDLACAEVRDQINHRFEAVGLFDRMAQWVGLGTNPDDRPSVPRCAGHVNRRGLTTAGKAAVTAMMAKGMLIDIDHMSQATANGTLTLAQSHGYPIFSGHNRPRVGGERNENTRTKEQYEKIRELQGVAGIGWSGLSAGEYLERLRTVSRLAPGIALSLGSDINGLVMQPGPPGGKPLSRSMPVARTGRREWTYNVDGVANIGLFPDFLAHLEEDLGGAREVSALFDGAEAVARAWEKAEAASRKLRTPSGSPSGPASVPGGAARDVALRQRSVGWYCPTRLVNGDREFGGNGPEMTAEAELFLKGGRELWLKVELWARETGGDRSETRGSWQEKLYQAPAGRGIERVLSDLRSETGRFVSSKGGFQILGGGGNAVSKPPIRGGNLVREWEVVGDTGGDDISTDRDCGDDTRIRVTLNEVRLRLTS